LLTDLYEMTMLQAYWRERMQGEAVFSLFARKLSPRRNYLLACGLNDVLHYLEHLHFGSDALRYLAGLGTVADEFLRWLETLRFTGDVYAVPEGTPIFAEEPLLEVVAPIAEADGRRKKLRAHQIRPNSWIALGRLHASLGAAATWNTGRGHLTASESVSG
jgi:nicotinate phosphoribosyltransferase